MRQAALGLYSPEGANDMYRRVINYIEVSEKTMLDATTTPPSSSAPSAATIAPSIR